VLRQPASLTLWTYLELQDADRIAGLIERSARYEGAALTGVAFADGKQFAQLDTAFRASLRRHPSPEVEAQRIAAAREKGEGLIVRADGFFGKQPTPAMAEA
jgi:hypothetical protein